MVAASSFPAQAVTNSVTVNAAFETAAQSTTLASATAADINEAKQLMLKRCMAWT